MFARHPVLLFTCFSLLRVLTSSMTTAETLSDTYSQMTGVSYKLTSPCVVHNTSLLSCAARCTQKQGKCWAFLYDQVEATCTLGVTISKSGTPLNGNSNLYAAECRSFLGFSVIIIGSSEYCLYFSAFKATYEEARNLCLSYGTRLWKCDSDLKLDYLLSRKANPTWVGLDDLGTEGTYVWSDGEVMTSQEKGDFFSEYNPDNYNNEDCCNYQGNQKRASSNTLGAINDLSCEESNYFVCEYITV